MDTAADLARKAANLHAFIDQYLPQGRLTGALPDISTDYVKLQEEVMCSVCRDVLVEPFTLECSHSFCSLCLREWLSRVQVCTVPCTLSL